MKLIKLVFPLFLSTLLAVSCADPEQTKNAFTTDDLMVRIAAIEIDSSSVDEYLAIIKEESQASVRLELGVISIFPMFEKENPTQIRLLEIYASKAAYESHLQTPHFKHYKEATLKMVKDLKLIEMKIIDVESMPKIFNKLKQ